MGAAIEIRSAAYRNKNKKTRNKNLLNRRIQI